MPNLVYTNGVFVPFTKISSSVMNQYFADIKSRVNWAGGTDATTGLGDTNIQSNAASGGGLTRSTKLKLGTANYAVFNDNTGAMTEAAALPVSAGGIGVVVVPGSQVAGDTVQINSALTGFIVQAPPTPAALRVFPFYRFS